MPVTSRRAQGSGAGRGRPRLVLLHVPPGLTGPSISHARASAWYFALSYAYASAYAFALGTVRTHNRSIQISPQAPAVEDGDAAARPASATPPAWLYARESNLVKGHFR